MWEIGLKRVRTPGRIDITTVLAREAAQDAGYAFLPLAAEHALAFEAVRSQHGDPFDRMLVAQALHEQLALVTHDRDVARYSDTFILV